MFNIFPKNDEFFDLFVQSAKNINRAAELLLELCQSRERERELVGAIREIEHQGDRLTREMLKLLNRSFITPFDREDIHAIASALDDVLDNIDDAANYYLLLEIASPNSDYTKLAELTVEASKNLLRIFEELKNPKTRTKTQALIHKLYEIESQGDTVHNHAIASLFHSEKDPIVIMKWKTLCDYLEEGLDACQRVGNSVEMVVMKSS